MYFYIPPVLNFTLSPIEKCGSVRERKNRTLSQKSDIKGTKPDIRKRIVIFYSS